MPPPNDRPGILPEQTIWTVVSLNDVFPTILAMAGLPLPALPLPKLAGRSLLPLIDGTPGGAGAAESNSTSTAVATASLPRCLVVCLVRCLIAFLDRSLQAIRIGQISSWRSTTRCVVGRGRTTRCVVGRGAHHALLWVLESL